MTTCQARGIDDLKLYWEPRILKHPPNYDSPWDIDRIVSYKKPDALNRKRVTVYVNDMVSGETITYQSYVDAARAIGADPGDIARSIIKKHIVKKRYICHL